MDVFEEQTRSPGIKSCYEVQDISRRGLFVLRSCAFENQVLFLEMKGASTDSSTAPRAEAAADSSASASDAVRTEPLEYLLDLRSKLMMTEIPPELEG